MKVYSQLPNLYLVGFMGSGKSTVGKKVAECLAMRFVDVDVEISKKMQLSITEIIENHGEPYFRKLEQAFIDEEHPREGCIIACGGGILTSEGMLEQLESRGIPICLLAMPETLLMRIKADPVNIRPLLNKTQNRLETINQLFTQRDSLYDAVRLKIVTDNKTIDKVAAQVVACYRSAIL